VPQWREYLAWHGVELFDLPLNMTFQQLSDFHEIGPTVQPRLDIGVFVLCTIVNFLSSVHRSDACLKFLRNQMFESTSFNIEHFRITSLDANLLIQHVFSNDLYPVEQLTDNTGYLLLLGAFQWVHQPHSSATCVNLFDLVLTRPSLLPADRVDISIIPNLGQFLICILP